MRRILPLDRLVTAFPIYDPAHVEKLAALLRRGGRLDPVMVYEQAAGSGVYIVRNGGHRVAAARRAGRTHVRVDLRRDALSDD